MLSHTKTDKEKAKEILTALEQFRFKDFYDFLNVAQVIAKQKYGEKFVADDFWPVLEYLFYLGDANITHVSNLTHLMNHLFPPPKKTPIQGDEDDTNPIIPIPGEVQYKLNTIYQTLLKYVASAKHLSDLNEIIEPNLSFEEFSAVINSIDKNKNMTEQISVKQTEIEKHIERELESLFSLPGIAKKIELTENEENIKGQLEKLKLFELEFYLPEMMKTLITGIAENRDDIDFDSALTAKSLVEFMYLMRKEFNAAPTVVPDHTPQFTDALKQIIAKKPSFSQDVINGIRETVKTIHTDDELSALYEVYVTCNNYAGKKSYEQCLVEFFLLLHSDARLQTLLSETFAVKLEKLNLNIFTIASLLCKKIRETKDNDPQLPYLFELLARCLPKLDAKKQQQITNQFYYKWNQQATVIPVSGPTNEVIASKDLITNHKKKLYEQHRYNYLPQDTITKYKGRIYAAVGTICAAIGAAAGVALTFTGVLAPIGIPLIAASAGVLGLAAAGQTIAMKQARGVAKPSFFSRHKGKIFFAAALLGSIIGAGLTATGFLAPLGIPLAAGSIAAMLVAGGVVGGAVGGAVLASTKTETKTPFDIEMEQPLPERAWDSDPSPVALKDTLPFNMNELQQTYQKTLEHTKADAKRKLAEKQILHKKTLEQNVTIAKQKVTDQEVLVKEAGKEVNTLHNELEQAKAAKNAAQQAAEAKLTEVESSHDIDAIATANTEYENQKSQLKTAESKINTLQTKIPEAEKKADETLKKVASQLPFFRHNLEVAQKELEAAIKLESEKPSTPRKPTTE